MSLNHSRIVRLAYIKFLYQHGVELSRKTNPYNSTSILLFHDSIDLFLQLAAELLNIQTKEKTYFMNYIDLINKKLAPKQLSQTGSMKRLNDARVSLKHKGLFLHESDIESCRVNSKDFFIENTPIIFGIEFSDISMIDVIDNENVKKILKDVKQFSKNGQFKEALEHIAISFNELISGYEKNRSSLMESIFDFDDIHESDFEFDAEVSGDYEGGFEKLCNILEEIQHKLKLLSFNIDIRKYAKFLQFTPHLGPGKDIYDKYTVYWDFTKDKNFNEEKVEFCINFIIESALKLQDFNL